MDGDMDRQLAEAARLQRDVDELRGRLAELLGMVARREQETVALQLTASKPDYFDRSPPQELDRAASVDLAALVQRHAVRPQADVRRGPSLEEAIWQSGRAGG